jgi:hypothetical protein
VGKRSNFERVPRDFYPTPYEAVPPLLPHLPDRTHFIEPCAGDGRLIGYLQEHGHICQGAYDTAPLDPCILPVDATHLQSQYPYDHLAMITNPPWTRYALHPIIDHLRTLHPTWLLIDMNWANTKQAGPYLRVCHKIIVIGRVKWIPDSPHSGKEDAGWFLFTKDECVGPRFYGRRGKSAMRSSREKHSFIQFYFDDWQGWHRSDDADGEIHLL